MDKILELTNIEKPTEKCLLNLENGNTSFYRGDKRKPDFSGKYYSEICPDDFAIPYSGSKIIALYPTHNGPRLYYEGIEYLIHPNLNIQLIKKDKKRRFQIKDYGIKFDYTEYPYFDWDEWSGEIDRDLFFMIEQRYKKQEFYDQYTLSNG